MPADDKENAHLIISQVIVDTLKKMRLAYPRMDKAQRRELLLVGKLLRE